MAAKILTLIIFTLLTFALSCMLKLTFKKLCKIFNKHLCRSLFWSWFKKNTTEYPQSRGFTFILCRSASGSSSFSECGFGTSSFSECGSGSSCLINANPEWMNADPCGGSGSTSTALVTWMKKHDDQQNTQFYLFSNNRMFMLEMLILLACHEMPN